MRITLGIGVARIGVDETITGLWSFANVLGLLTDVIGELTPAAGVTIDGLLVKDAGIPEAAVTAHEAALAILESQIVDGTLLARLAANDVFTGLPEFSHASGLKTDDIVERTGAAGVTVDDVLMIAGNISQRTRAAASTIVNRSNVAGDTIDRFTKDADGRMQWGPGNATLDANLFRLSADRLKTDDALDVGGVFRPLSILELSVNQVALAADANNLSIAGKVVQRVDSAGAFDITGFSGGDEGRIIIVYNGNTQSFQLDHQSASSTAANRIITHTGLNVALIEAQAVILVYDGTVSRWRIVSSTLVV